MRKSNSGAGDLLSAATTELFFIVIILLVVFSAAVYRHVIRVQMENNNERALLSYVITCIRECGDADIRQLEGQDGIAIESKTPGYERRIYVNDGKLVEEYTQQDAEPSPESALVIGETGTFQVSMENDALVRVKTDLGVSYVHVQTPKSL